MLFSTPGLHGTGRRLLQCGDGSGKREVHGAFRQPVIIRTRNRRGIFFIAP
jgi:hypothetical protein